MDLTEVDGDSYGTTDMMNEDVRIRAVLGMRRSRETDFRRCCRGYKSWPRMVGVGMSNTPHKHHNLQLPHQTTIFY